ncbi:MAG: short-chain dehydrogenase [Lentimicrobium sp.]|nr:short-chain dehydrogenase [Lentimicrobium sp.]
MIIKSSGFRDLWNKAASHHLDNKRRGVYGYMWWTSLKIVVLYFIIVIPLVLIGKRLLDFDSIFSYITQNLSDRGVLLTFFISESFLGMIPPDIFMIWATKFDSPVLILTLLGVLSYFGGAISCKLGYWFSKRPVIKAYTEQKLKRYILLTRKWGGAFIVIASLFPFSPLSMVCIAAGVLKYPLRLYLFFGLTRIIRFLFQGMLYSGLFHMENILTKLS